VSALVLLLRRLVLRRQLSGRARSDIEQISVDALLWVNSEAVVAFSYSEPPQGSLGHLCASSMHISHRMQRNNANSIRAQKLV
jgi:hypothetical protein